MEGKALVESFRRRLEVIQQCGDEPILLEGPTGSGKTATVEYLAHKLKKTLIKVQLGEQSDSKSILGTYCCSEIPGLFYWRNSAILEAMLNGHWLLLEDLDQSPVDVLGVLLPLLESRSLLVPGLGNEKVEAKQGFRMFATSRLVETPSGYSRIQTNPQFNVVAKLFLRIIVEPMNDEEMIEAITQVFSFESIESKKLVSVYLELAKNQPLTMESQGDTPPKYCSSRLKQFTMRDLLKWCQRIHRIVTPGSMTKAHAVPDAFDLFAAGVPMETGRVEAHKRVAGLIGLDHNMAEKQCLTYQADVRVTERKVHIGRHTLERLEDTAININRVKSPKFAYTRQTSCLLESIAGCVLNDEPVLLVGETGTGKTSTVQYLAHVMNANLLVVNMNQQSDSSDLLGAYRPVDVKKLVRPLWEKYRELFAKSLVVERNQKFLRDLDNLFFRDMFTTMFQVMKATLGKTFISHFEEGHELRREWLEVSRRIAQLETLVEQCSKAPAFSFVEGALVRAIKNGDWILLDEINLATAETLESLCGLLESAKGSVTLADRGDHEPVVRHENFRLFACMNPALDVGKKDLPVGLRSRFTEFYVDEIVDSRNLSILVQHYLQGTVRPETVEGMVGFYQEMRRMSSRSLNDGVGRSPHFSMRTLCRALVAAGGASFGGLTRSIYEGFCVSFLTQLDRKSYEIVKNLIDTHILNGKPLKMHSHNQPPKPDPKLVECQGYLILKGDLEPHIDESYILTPSVENNLKDLARAVAARGLPVLLQGETSVGKTSMITYLAKATGNRCYRINNHEHTDVQEYVGTYAADGNGQLVFKEGTLVKAMRKGYWIILDELNLAPSEVLEALNRLLDDNRELFISETQETVKAHERFLVFATQNPAGLYGGRKELSRAFRNRFVELHFDEIPRDELESILHRRTNISPSHGKKLVKIMQDLQRMRKNSSLFSGKQGFITLRELFRWAERYNKCTQEDGPADRDWDQIFANQGYFLLAAKVRQDSEEEIIRQVIKTHLKKEIDIEALFASFNFYKESDTDLIAQQQQQQLPQINTKDKKELRKMKKLKRKEEQKVKRAKGGVDASSTDRIATVPGFEHVVMTRATKRMAVLVSEAVKHREPVLLVGETGCGKTTVCQMLARHCGLELLTLNCHLHTETSDFLGGLRPVRHREENSNRLFEWRDGPLITAMKDGAMFLVDEISLADDSVLERLNSVLEPERKLLLVEKGGEDEREDSEEIVANEKFLLVATMNPGGDFGKKELSPALRNRFTEIWCPLSREEDDWTSIVAHNLKQGLPGDEIARMMADFVGWMKKQNETKKIVVSIRDLLSWTAFVNATAVPHGTDARATSGGTDPSMIPEVAYVHGALMVFVDALQTDQLPIKEQLLRYLCRQVGCDVQDFKDRLHSPSIDAHDDSYFVVGPFKIPRGPAPVDRCACDFAFRAPTTSSNAVRVVRALQLHRPILLEGSPGVGKTSLVLALAKASGRQIVRINLSDQTDVSDLFGADLPVDGGKCGEFQWVDGPLLAGLKAGHWIVLDELNLATQSVLEGLNACFDHRAEVFVPELSQTFRIDHERTRIFACQNPVFEGGDRKGLPKSFLNRFTQVYVDQLTFDDLVFILRSLHPEFPEKSLVPMVTFNQMMHKAINQEKRFGQNGGGAWDFNLRDLLRWCQLCIKNAAVEKPGRYVDTVYMMRMRTAEDRLQAEDIFEKIFNEKYSSYVPRSDYLMTDSMVQVGNSFLRRSQKALPSNVDERHPLRFLQANARALASLVECVNMNWLAILVGPSGCGKTSLLKTLSHLSGKELHSMSMNANMDTTELLGSFEQASFRKKIKAFTDTWSGVVELNCQGFEEVKRHWAEFVQSQKAIVDEKEMVGKSLKAVEMLQKLKDALALTGSSYLHAIGLDEAICTMQESCSKVECGKFEWVDSLLLTCMKQGWWIVLDNINFCSSSVLDRLNGAQEPNGKLRLDELGTDDDGKVPEITPHPDFRLFLTMDPKNGDISRAMRNRGIEVAMLPLKGACPSDREDLVGLLNETGITPTVVKSVLNFHRALTEDQELHSEVSGLVRACRLIHERTKSLDENKISVSDKKRILGDAFDLVYVNGCHDNRLKEKLGKLVDSALSEHFSLSARTTVIPLPGLNNWTKNTNLAMLNKASILIRRILYLSAEINVLPSLDSDVQSELADGLALVFASLIAIQSNSPKSLKLLPQHLAKHLSKKQLGANQDLVHRMQCIAKAMTYISGHPLVKLFLNALGNCTDKAQLPMNVYQNSAFLHSSGLNGDHVSVLRNICRQLAVLFNWNVIGSDLTNRMEAAQPMALKHGNNASQMLSFIQLAKSYSAGHIHKDSLPHAMVPQLVLYTKVIVEEVGSSLKCILEWNDETMNGASEGLHWLKALISSLGESVVGRQLLDEKMMDTSLLAKWTDKKLGDVFESSFSTNHTNLVAVLKAALDFDGRIDKFHVAAVSAFGRAAVFKNQSDAELFVGIKSLQDKYFAVDEHLLSSNFIKVKDIAKWLRFLSDENVSRAKQTLAGLVEKLAAGLCLTGEEASIALEMDGILEKVHDGIFGDESVGVDDGLVHVCSEIPTSFHLMPVRNYFLSCHSGLSLLSMLSSALPDDDNLIGLARLAPIMSMNNNFNELFGVALSNQQNLAKFQLIGCYLRTLQSNCMSKALPYLIGALESVKPGLPKKDDDEEEMDTADDDFDCGIIRQARRETKSNIFSGFSNFVFEIMDPGRKMEVEGQPADSDNSWLLSAVQLKLASKKLQITKSLEGHIWTYLSNQELDTWNNIKNNVMVLDQCMHLVVSCLSQLSSMMPSDNPIMEKLFQTAQQQLERAKILLEQSYTNQGLFSSVGVAVGAAWLCLGQLQLKMLCPREGSVDQVRKVSIRLAGVKAMIKEANTEIALRLTNRKIQGHYLNDDDDDDDDVRRLKLHLEELKMKEEKLQTKLAYRPVPSQYPELCRELARFARDDFNVDRVVEATRELASAFEAFVARKDQPHAAKLTASMSGVQTLHGRTSMFLRKFDRSFHLYPDETTGIVSALRQCEFGLDSLASCSLVELEKYSLSKGSSFGVDEMAQSLAVFPITTLNQPDVCNLVDLFVSKDFLLFARKVEEKSGSSSLINRLLRACSLLLLNSSATASSDCDRRKLLHLLSTISTTYHSRWLKQEEEKRRKEEEEASIFKFKTVGSTMTEDETDAMEILRDFPTFAEDFEDIAAHDALSEQSKPQSTASSSTKSTAVISDEDLDHFVSVYLDIMAEDKPSEKETVVDWFPYWNLVHRMTSEVFRDSTHLIDPKLEKNLMTNHLMALCFVRSSLENKQTRASKKALNVYKDADIGNATRCLQVLENLKNKVKEFLVQWPEHPTLIQLTVIADRILAFPVSCPPMKFTRGLEMILETGQLWMEKASKRVSLAGQLEEVTKLVKVWRAMELSGWKASLDQVEEESRKRSCKWWYHVYSILQSLLKDLNEGKSKSLTRDEKLSTLRSLEELMENSPVGEFHSRLKIVLSFRRYLCHLVTEVADDDCKKALGTLANIFHGVYEHYHQFSAPVGKALTDLRGPIEKELKDHIKIVTRSKDEDVNYFSVRSLCHKSHKAIHKFTKQYRLHLQQPVRPLMVDKLVDWQKSTEAVNKPANRKRGRSKKEAGEGAELFFDLTPEMFTVPLTEDGQTNAIFKKMLSFCKKIINQSALKKNIGQLDLFNGDVLETIQYLEAMKPEGGATKEKRIKELKRIQTMKRKSLNDLFKALKYMGLSHKKGLAHHDSSSPEEVSLHWFESSPAPDALLGLGSDQKEVQEFLVNQMKKVRNYLTRCFSRRSLLMSLLSNHHKEMDSVCLERSRGYCEHLHVELLKQKRSLTNTLETFQQLRLYLNDVNNVSADVPNQPIARDWKDKSEELFGRSAEYLHQLAFFVDAVSSDVSEACEEDKAFIALVGPAGAQRNGTRFIAVKDMIKNCLKYCEDFGAKKEQTLIPSLSSIDASFEKLLELAANLHLVDEKLSLTGNSGASESIVSPRKLIGLIEYNCHGYEEFKRSHVNGDDETLSVNQAELERPLLEEFKRTCQSLATSCLKGVERLVKEIQSKKIDDAERKEEAEQDGGDSEDNVANVTEENLISNINADIEKCLENLNMTRVTNQLASIVDTISYWSVQTRSANHVKEAAENLAEISGILAQYGKLSQFFVTLQVSGVKETSKLHSILLRLFSELAEKGFCTPPELSEETDDSKGAEGTTFEDIEEGGMGEGEGIRDVTDQIDNEGQVEGLQSDKKEDKKDDEKKDDDDDEEDKAIEMSNDFDGELSDPRKKDGNDEDDDDDDEGVDESEIEKQMGDVGDTGEEEKLDEKMWGDDEQEEDDDNPENKKDDHGKGTNAENSEAELGAKGAQEGDPQEQGKDGKGEDENHVEEEEEDDDDGKTAGKEADHIPDESQYDDETEKKASKDGLKEEEDNTEGDDLEIPEDLKIEDEGQAEAGDDAQPEEKPADDDDDDGKGENGENEEKMEVDEDETKMDEQEGEDVGEKPTDDAAADLDKNEDDNPNEIDPGLQAAPSQDRTTEDGEENEDDDREEEKEDENEEACMQTHHETQDVQGVADLQDTAATAQVDLTDEQKQKENQGRNLGQENSARQDDSANKIMADSSDDNKKDATRKRQREANEDRSVGNVEEKSSKRLKTMDCKEVEEYKDRSEDKPADKDESANEYAHSKDSSAPNDAQVMDAATQEQLEKFQQPSTMETEESFKPDEEAKMKEEEEEEMEVDEVPELQPKSHKNPSKRNEKQKQTNADDDDDGTGQSDEVEPESRDPVNPTNWVARGKDSFINRPIESQELESERVDVEAYRRMVEEEMMNVNMNVKPAEAADQSEWSRYESATSHLSQDLCEQLRLILEPTQASKLKGDYKTGKRISMRKVIQYIASQFRKDRIWLRRTRPCKRQYQIMLAIDDSESMKCNGLEELALESVAIIMNALSKLEVGNMGVCSFGKEVSVLHPLGKPFTNQCGGNLVKNLKFDQTSTDFVQMIKTTTGLFSSHNRSSGDGSIPHRLLLIVSDGGIRNSAEWTRPAVKYARERGIFIVCIIVDNPESSIFDVMMATFHGQGKVELTPAMDSFPIPFYSVVRDAKNLPQTLADSLRQWFEMTSP